MRSYIPLFFMLFTACKVQQPSSSDNGIPTAMVKAMRWQEAHPIQANAGSRGTDISMRMISSSRIVTCT
ncbi:MAG: hypothetical protein LW694_06215 [Chitinophagaceae bacterium]|nr:hypothetical protein [Chitinophagaceae bacterium]